MEDTIKPDSILTDASTHFVSKTYGVFLLSFVRAMKLGLTSISPISLVNTIPLPHHPFKPPSKLCQVGQKIRPYFYNID